MTRRKDELTYDECCELVKESLEHAITTLAHVYQQLERTKEAPWNAEHIKQNALYVKNVLCNIHYYGAYLHGMRILLLKLRDFGLLEEARAKNGIPHARGDELVINKALVDLLFSDNINFDRFLLDEYQIRFTDHVRNKKGKLVKCRAYFAKSVITNQEIK